MEIILSILCLISIAAFTLCRMHTALHMMQLNSYMNERYLKWLNKNFLHSNNAFLVLLVVVPLHFLQFYNTASLILAIYGICTVAVFIKKKNKKPLVYTNRALRLLFTLTLLVVLPIFGAVYLRTDSTATALYMFVVGSLVFYIIMAANLLNAPLEKYINKSYYKDAQAILKKYPNLIIIGITGSYGKTSTKHFLHRILSEKYNVLMTPGSYNTTMGVIRTIREELKPIHQVFIVEMGAKQIGDIKEICDLVKPTIGILTAIAEQHLDTFGNIANVTRAKFELINALPENGLAILNADYPEIANHPRPACQTKYYSVLHETADYHATTTYCDSLGTSFEITKPQPAAGPYKTNLLGTHNISNILASIIAAMYLGVPQSDIRYAVDKLRPVKHRMEIKKTPSGITIIDDAFNSNPSGAKMALDVLKLMRGGKKIIITPGIVDLAGRTEYYNKTLGTQISAACDYAVLVGKTYTPHIRQGLLESGFASDRIHLAKNLAAAAQHVNNLARPGDILLYENDLPDNYE